MLEVKLIDIDNKQETSISAIVPNSNPPQTATQTVITGVAGIKTKNPDGIDAYGWPGPAYKGRIVPGGWIREFDFYCVIGPDVSNANRLGQLSTAIIVFPATVFFGVPTDPYVLNRPREIGWGIDTASAKFDPNTGRIKVTATIVVDHEADIIILRAGFQLTITTVI
jgi:hypothetical protein